jgi:hypothetical protein
MGYAHFDLLLHDDDEALHFSPPLFTTTFKLRLFFGAQHGTG